MTTRIIAWIDTLSVHDTVRDAGWIVPTVQTIHILAVSVVFASSLILSLRVVGVTGSDWSPAQWTQRLKGWIWIALLALLLTGAVMIIGEPERTLPNRTFQLKMTALVVAVALSGALFSRLRSVGAGHETSGTDRGIAVMLILVWTFIVLAGRWIAYS